MVIEFDGTDKIMEWDFCPSCAEELDKGFECNSCGRDWRPWAMAFECVQETESDGN